MRTAFTVLVSLYVVFLSCTDNKQTEPVHEDNIAITLSFPDDPLIETVTSVKLVVSATDLADPVSDSQSLLPTSGGSAVISTWAPTGPERLFTIYLLQANGTIAFWANHTDDVPEDADLEFSVAVAQAAFGSASRIKIFRDNLPWDSQALGNMLAELGITLGAEDNQYLIMSSATLDTVSLIAGEDLVIIANDQNQVFYNNYAAYQNKIDAFVREGGCLFWEACDLGWAGGSIAQAGIDLPGGIEIIGGYENYNYITSSLWQLTDGIDSTLFGTYASHEGFGNLSQGAVTYTIDSRGLPTLISYNYGVGWVVLTGQPLEYAYDRRDSLNTGELLPRIIRLILGLTPQTPVSVDSPGRSAGEPDQRIFNGDFKSSSVRRQY